MHVYASLADAKSYIAEEGLAWGAGSTNDQLALSILESASRRVDAWCRRSSFGSGFGPRIGTNRYDASGGTSLALRDDLLSTTSVTSLGSTGSATTTTLVAETDFYLLNQKGSYDSGPYRKAVLHGNGVTAFGKGKRVVSWAGAWGHQDVTRPLVPTTAEALDDSETECDVSALTGLSPGMTVLIGSEQLYITALTDSTTKSITVVRGVNGTIAATHLTAAPIARYVYDSTVVDVTLRIWLRRWRARDAGADGTDGGGDVGVLVPRESEDTILRRGVGHLRLLGQVVF
jgi:hypothetical protein